ncbi:MAG: glycoside hydrolase family 3 C-terminal domain-containing protein [Acidobacteriota bacterium]|nr:glycoside hydrolase family 3 C-terminal domain-containing protein [Acidobacteriota bacterium]
MKSIGVCRAGAALLLVATSLLCAQDKDKDKPAYLDTSLPPQVRAADLVSRMTLEEKASQLVNQARAIPRLDIPRYDWWSEALHGVATQGITEFPEPIGLGATFDSPTIHKMAVAISIEARIKHDMFVKENGGYSKIFQGLDFWAPNVNIFRDPRWGRGQETYGEDPYLTSRMGVAFVKGMQGDDSRYYRVIATPKHFNVHSGPEPTRHKANVDVSLHDELDTYLPAFRATVVDGKAGSVMCAYNSINGQPACANQFLLEDELRGWWNFNGYVVSDCGAVLDIHSGHHFATTQAEASAISLKRGMDNECVDFTFDVKDDHDYKPYLDAVKDGYLSVSDIDRAVTRLYKARIKLGMFDPPSMVPYADEDPKQLDSPEHRALALKLANESMVLLKNDGTLPLKTSGIKIAVVGPLAEQTKVLLGNYNGQPTHTVSILDGLKKEFANATITYEHGTQFLGHDASPVPASALSFNGKPGVKASYSKLDMSNLNNPGEAKPVAEQVESTLDETQSKIPSTAASLKPLAIHFEAMLTAPETGDYNLGMVAAGFFRMNLDGKSVTSSYGGDGKEAKLGRVHLEGGKPEKLEVDYAVGFGTDEVKAQLVWSKVDLQPQPAAIQAAKRADVIVAVVGITSELEGEEMHVNEPGFLGGDRTKIDLPEPEQNLLKALKATGKPLVVVLTNGSALAVNWAAEHANAILDAWYPGEEGGTAVAQTLAGVNNPGGKLPVTFYTGIDQLPPFEDYAMKNRTYRYFTGKPLYPFGYGLSYTKFAFSKLDLPTAPVKAMDGMTADVTVANTGKLAGDEVAELYLSFPKLDGAPIRALRGFERVHLAPGESKVVHFKLKPRDLSMVTEAGQIIVPPGHYTLSVGGGQPGTGVPTVEGGFDVGEQLILPD